MPQHQQTSCNDCQSVTRRDFMRTVGAVAAVGAVQAVVPRSGLFAAPSKSSTAETVVAELYGSLSDAQKAEICFDFNHNLRSNINANWAITKPTIGSDFYTKSQQGMIDKILRGVTSEDGYARLQQQMEYDDGGVESYHVALFGDPGSDKFEWELTGRHLTIRADGNSVEKAAFGGPLVYGHGEESPTDNLFYYQTQKANEVFAALDTQQRERALLQTPPRETAVQLPAAGSALPGIKVGDLAANQIELVESVVKTILAPYRAEDTEEALAILKEGGGLAGLHMAFYQESDLGNDKTWDIWRIEGPTFVSHFRGAPHVHAYLNVGMK